MATKLIPAAIIAQAFACALFAGLGTAPAMELPSRTGNVPFDHRGHIAHEGGRCVVCHHTSAGRDVRQTCRECHGSSTDAVPDIRTAFHDSCIGCHEKLHRSQQPAGPVKRCSGCHIGTSEKNRAD